MKQIIIFEAEKITSEIRQVVRKAAEHALSNLDVKPSQADILSNTSWLSTNNVVHACCIDKGIYPVSRLDMEELTYFTNSPIFTYLVKEDYSVKITLYDYGEDAVEMDFTEKLLNRDVPTLLSTCLNYGQYIEAILDWYLTHLQPDWRIFKNDRIYLLNTDKSAYTFFPKSWMSAWQPFWASSINIRLKAFRVAVPQIISLSKDETGVIFHLTEGFVQFFNCVGGKTVLDVNLNRDKLMAEVLRNRELCENKEFYDVLTAMISAFQTNV